MVFLQRRRDCRDGSSCRRFVLKLVATIPVRNEAWVLGASLRVALRWCDEICVLNHCSTDRTGDIIAEVAEEYPGRVTVIYESDPSWHEMHHRQRLLEAARKRGATHIALVDADEILCGNLLPYIRDEVERLKPGQYLHSAMTCPWRSLDQLRIDGRIWANRWDLALAFADDPGLSWHANNGYDHHHRQPFGAQLARRLYHFPGGVMHLQFASWRRLTAKHARYKMMERVKYPAKRVEDIDRMYSMALNENGLQVAEIPSQWWEPYQNLRLLIDLYSDPWQEAECRRLWMRYGAEVFAGLNLFGVAGECVAA